MPTDSQGHEPVDLFHRGRQLLAMAHGSAAGRAASNLVPGTGEALTQTLLALTARAALADHTAPGPATLQVLDGSGMLTVHDRGAAIEAGQWIRVPEGPHGLSAITDLVCLLTVASHGRGVTENPEAA